jgi:hypothetical protein
MVIPGDAAEALLPSLCPIPLSRLVSESGARRRRLRYVEIVPRGRPDCGRLNLLRLELSDHESAAGSITLLNSLAIGHHWRKAAPLPRLTDTRLTDRLRQSFIFYGNLHMSFKTIRSNCHSFELFITFRCTMERRRKFTSVMFLVFWIVAEWKIQGDSTKFPFILTIASVKTP